MPGFLDLFGPLAGGGSGFPFGLPPSATPPASASSFASDIQTGDIGGAPSWGKPPVPGATGAAPGQLSAVNPGGVDVPPPLIGGGGDAALAGGAKEDTIPPATPPAATPATPLPPGTPTLPPRTNPAVPSLMGTPSLAPSAAPGANIPVPPSGTTPGGNIPGGGTTFTKLSTTAPPGGTPPAGLPPVKAEKAAPGIMEKLKGLSDNEKFMGALGKTTAAATGGQGQGPDLSISGGGGGDPTQASRANAAKLFASILEGHAAPAPGAVPKFPKGLMEGF